MTVRANVFQVQAGEVGMIGELTRVFENIASLRISQTKTKVQSSTEFFNELWTIYTQLRFDPNKRLTNKGEKKSNGRNAFLVITSQGSLSGDIDERIVKRTIKDYNAADTDIIVIGSHGVNLFGQRNVQLTASFDLPEDEERMDIGPIAEVLAPYAKTSIFYERYVSLIVQETDRIELLSAVQDISESEEESAEIISSRDYLFEPSLKEVTEFMEGAMVQIAIGQVVLESRLAQYASRFSAMNAAHTKADELRKQYDLLYHRAKRAEGDERLKEVVNAMNAVSKAQEAHG